jgi:hypothetical protein
VFQLPTKKRGFLSLMSHHACYHTCYTTQLMHYSHFKTQSLQHLKPIKCSKRVCKYKTPTCFGLFFTTIFRGSSAVLCVVTIPPADLRSLSANQREEHLTAQSTAEDPLKMVVKKRPKHVGVLYLQTRF